VLRNWALPIFSLEVTFAVVRFYSLSTSESGRLRSKTRDVDFERKGASARATKAYGKVRRDRPRDRRGIKIAETVKGCGNATDD